MAEGVRPRHVEEIVGPRRIGGTPVYLDLDTDDVAAVFERAVAAGATPIRRPTDPALPVWSAKVRDPFGHVWLITGSGGESTQGSGEVAAGARPRPGDA